MPIDTDVDVRMPCFGKWTGRSQNYCDEACCMIEQNLCEMQEMDNQGVRHELKWESPD